MLALEYSRRVFRGNGDNYIKPKYQCMKPPFFSIARFRGTVLEALFPQSCALCGKILCEAGLKTGKNVFYGLCMSCREMLSVPAAERGRCSCCGQPLISEIGTCLPCRNGPPRSFNKVISLFPYMGRYKKILGAYKFGKCLSLGNFFAEKLRQALPYFFNSEDSANQEKINELVWVPVPPRPGKIKHNGWDQIEYLAKLLSPGKLEKAAPEKDGISLPVHRLLVRLPSKSQKELSREKRLENLKGRIIVNNSAQIPKTAVLFDDVYTTGSTIDACAAALKLAGTTKVYGVCLCYD